MKLYCVDYVVIKSAIYAEKREMFLKAENLNDVIKELDKKEHMRYYIIKIYEESESGCLIAVKEKNKIK